MKYFIANWKANKNIEEGLDWINQFSQFPFQTSGVKIIICPPAPFLSAFKSRLTNPLIALGAQDISSFDTGSYTGEITAKNLEHLVDFVIVGHSERRMNFKDSDETIAKKCIQAKKYSIQPILCVRDEKDAIPSEVEFVAYEPPWAISSGYEDSINTHMEIKPQAIVEMKKKLNLSAANTFIYGGSVNPNNSKEYLATGGVDGFLVGGASLKPKTFYEIISMAEDAK